MLPCPGAFWMTSVGGGCMNGKRRAVGRAGSLTLVILVACGEAGGGEMNADAGSLEAGEDAGGRRDAGVRRDAAAGTDSGPDPTDVDAGTEPVGSDAGIGGDAGATPGGWPCDGRPDATNTGPTGSLREYSGPTEITTDGATIEGFRLTGGLVIDADDVTIRNFVIEASSSYGINIRSDHEGIVIEDGEIFGMSSAAILGVGYTARRLNIHDSSGDGLKAQGSGGPTLVEHSYIHRLGRGDGAHADGNQTRGGSNITFRCNNIYMPSPGTPDYPGAPYKSNATFMLQLAISDFLIEYNWLTGGNYSIYGSSGVTVRNNLFGRYNGGWPDKEERRIRTGSFDAWENNAMEDGEPL